MYGEEIEINFQKFPEIIPAGLWRGDIEFFTPNKKRPTKIDSIIKIQAFAEAKYTGVNTA